MDKNNLPDLLVAQEGYSVGDVNPSFVRGEVFVFFNQSTTLIDSCTVIIDPYTQAIQIPIAAYGQYNLSLDFSNVPGQTFNSPRSPGKAAAMAIQPLTSTIWELIFRDFIMLEISTLTMLCGCREPIFGNSNNKQPRISL
ncbi:MAG: hypothetical protein NTU74_02105 [Deltaproteobacteria bacterium]|nr:hypothetical protein [Deltaproteobacteria bacterium]